MKVYAIFAIFALFGVVFADDNGLLSKIFPSSVNAALDKQAQLFQEKLAVKITPEFVEEFWTALQTADKDNGGNTTIINEFTDRILDIIANFIIYEGRDPMQILDLPISIAGGEMNLTRGWLESICTIHRDGDVVTSYDPNSKKFDISIPIAFEALNVHYKFKALVPSFSGNGEVGGQLVDVKANLQFEFDFTINHAQMVKFEIKNSGQLTLHFTGQGLVESVIKLLSEATTPILQTVIIRIVPEFITVPVKTVVFLVNSIIDAILHPITTSTVANLLN